MDCLILFMSFIFSILFGHILCLIIFFIADWLIAPFIDWILDKIERRSDDETKTTT